jgi:hypothetical protein
MSDDRAHVSIWKSIGPTGSQTSPPVKHPKVSALEVVLTDPELSHLNTRIL